MRQVVRILPWPLAIACPPWTEAALYCPLSDAQGDSCITRALLEGFVWRWP